MTIDATTAVVEHRIGARGRFSLSQPAGEIAIRGVEGEIARVRDLDDEPIADSFEVEAAEGSLELRPRVATRRSAPNLSVEVPHGATVVVESASADVAAADLTGDKRFRTASGAVSLVRLAGSVDVGTVSGEIEIDGQVQLGVVGKTISGDLHLRLPGARRLDFGTTSGDAVIDAELAGEGPYTVRTISGNLTLVARGGLRIEAQTVTGEIGGDAVKIVESGGGRKVVVVGRPSATLAFRSVSGDLAVIGPDGAPPSRREVDPAAAMPDPGDTSPATASSEPEPPVTTATDDARLEILRALERGELSVAEAGERLSQLEEVLR